MTDKKFLSEVYDLVTPAQTRAMYDNWAQSYDDEMSENGYATPTRIAEALARHLSDQSSAVLDFACGTGLSGLALTQAGFMNVDGADLSADMLKGAAEKQIYRKLWQVEAGDSVPGAPGTYSAITATGVIGVGAAPVSVFDVLMTALLPGGLFAFSYNDHALADPHFEDKLKSYTDTEAARLLFQEYGKHLPGIDLKSNVYIIEKT